MNTAIITIKETESGNLEFTTEYRGEPGDEPSAAQMAAFTMIRMFNRWLAEFDSAEGEV